MPALNQYDFSLDGQAAPSIGHVGAEHEPLLQIDGVLRHPDALIDYAAAETRFAPAYGPSGGYPGIRAPAPLDYVGAVVRAVDPLLRQAFGLDAVKLGRAECNFSLVTLSPDALVPAQREPHVDTSDPLQFAFLHYLCDACFGGTGFYRHRRTGFETLTPERLDAYALARAEEGEGTPGYVGADSPHFDRTAAVEAAMNRLVVYRSRVLHSGQIPPDAPLSPDPRQGRLTANIFVTYRQA
jgi:hypothetical protein